MGPTMSNEIRHDKKVEVTLDKPYNTNGYYHGHKDGDPRKAFIGKTTVNEQDAADLEQRKAAYAKYDASRHRDNGQQIAAGNINGGGE